MSVISINPRQLLYAIRLKDSQPKSGNDTCRLFGVLCSPFPIPHSPIPHSPSKICFSDNIRRSVLCLYEDFADVYPCNAKHEQIDTAYKQNRNDG